MKNILYKKLLSDDVSFQLARTNPKLTGNVKLTINESGNMWLDSINANLELAKDEYSRVAIDTTHSLASNIHRFFKNGTTPNEIIFDLKENVDTTKTSKDYKDQFDFSSYFSGIKYFPSNKYEERLSYFAPIYLKKEIPNYFIILKIKNPINYPINISKEKFDSGISTDQYIIDLFKDAEIIKTFDLTPESKVGSYLRSYINDPGQPVGPLSVSFKDNEYTTWNGIIVNSGILGSRGELLYSQYQSSTPLKFFEELITNGFSRNGVIFPNILNLEFIFNDDTSNNYDFNRYLGLYVNQIELSTLELDLARAYAERLSWENSPRLKRQYYDYDETVLNQKNEDGIIFPYSKLGINMAEFENIFKDSENLYFNYLTDKDGKMYLPKLNSPYTVNYGESKTLSLSYDGFKITAISQNHGFETDSLINIISNSDGYSGTFFITVLDNSTFTYFPENIPQSAVAYGTGAIDIGTGKLKLSNTEVDFAKFFGPSSSTFLQDVGVADNSPNISNISIKIIKTLNHGDSLKLYHPNGTKKDSIGKYDIFTATVNYSELPNPGEYYAFNDYDNIVGYDTFYFNGSGQLSEISQALTNCLNNVRNRSFTAYNFNEYIFIKCNSPGDFDKLHKLQFNSLINDYSTIKIDDITEDFLINSIINFNGGDKFIGNRLILDKNHKNKIESSLSDLLVKSNNGWSKIKKISKYVDLITDTNQLNQADRLFAINEYNEKIVLLLENNDTPTISHTEFLIRRKFKPSFGLISLFPIKDIDFNFYTSEYLNFPIIDLYQNYFIPENIELLSPFNESGQIIQYQVVGSGTIKINGNTDTFSSKTIDLSSPYTFPDIFPFITLPVDPNLSFDPSLNQLIKVEYDTTSYFIGTVDSYYSTSTQGFLKIKVSQVIYPQYTVPPSISEQSTHSNWKIYQIATQDFPFNVKETCSYSIQIGNAFVSYLDSIDQPLDILTHPINDENGELNNFQGFSILKDPTKVIDQQLTKEFNLKLKYLNGLTKTEYDFYKENDSQDFSRRSKIIPYITKWGIKNGLDSRDNPYRLNTEIVFGRNNFSPDHTDQSQNPNNFTHEWFYIESKFNYLNDKETVKLNTTYFDSPLNLSLLLSDPNYFINYFTYTPKFQSSTSNKLDDVGITQFRYSTLFKNKAGEYETFFKGFKMLFKDVSDGNTLGVDGKPLSKKETSRFENYKFSAIVKVVKENFIDKSQSPIKYKMIEHKDYGWIVLIIEIALGHNDQIHDYWKEVPSLTSPTTPFFKKISNADTDLINQNILFSDPNYAYVFDGELPYSTVNGDYRIIFDQTEGISNLSHSLIYSLKHKKFNNLINTFSNIKLPFQLNITSNGINTAASSIKKINISDIDNYPSSVSDEIIITKPETFIKIFDQSTGQTFFIDQSDYLFPYTPILQNPISTAITDFAIYSIDSNNNLVLSKPDDSAIYSKYTSVYSQLPITNSLLTLLKNNYTFSVTLGGEKYFEKLFEKLSFSKFKKFINEFNPIIEYSSYSIINGVSTLNESSNFYVEILDPININKKNQVIPVINEDRPTQYSFNSIISYNYELSNLSNSLELNRYQGEYEPLSISLLHCNSNFKFYKNKISDLTLSNTKLNTNINNLLTIKKFNHIKISNTKILDLESDPSYLPEYPLIDEIAIGQSDYFLLRGNWDWGFHHNYLNKSESAPTSGAIRVEEDECFLGKIVIVPESIELENFKITILSETQSLSSIDLSKEELVLKENSQTFDGYINLNNAITTYLLNDGISEKFNNYLIAKNEFIGNFNSLEDYIKEYIKLNILKLYSIETTEFYVKRDASIFSQNTVNPNSINFVFLNDSQRFTQQYQQLKDVQINKFERLILNFSIKKNLSAGFNISPKIKIKFI